MAAAVLVGGAAAIEHARAYTYPTLAALRAAPISGSGVLPWPARGGDAGNEYVVRAALQKLRSAGGRDKPTTALHLIYAGSGLTVLAGRTEQGRPALAEVTRDSVRRSLLTTGSPPALTLPIAPNVVRFLVAPSDSGTGPSTVFVEDPVSTGFNGFIPLLADPSGLTDPTSIAGITTRFVVLAGQPGPDGYTIDAVRGDGTVLPASLVPGTPRVRFGSPPWPGTSAQLPTTTWVKDAEALARLAPAHPPVTVVTVASGGCSNSAAAPGTMYCPSLYFVRAGGTDYLGYVLETDGNVESAVLEPVPGSFSQLSVVGYRNVLPDRQYAVIVLAARPDVARVAMDVTAGGGQPAQHFPSAGSGDAGAMFFVDGGAALRNPIVLTAYGRDGRRLGEYRISGG